jgi:hypothetical protein
VKSARVDLLASREDAWGFLAEPYHLSDWWPGITGVEPDLRGFAEGARWTVQVVDAPTPYGLFRLPRMGRPSGRSSNQILVITAIEQYERWAWNLVMPLRQGGGKSAKSMSVEIRLSFIQRDRTLAEVSVSGFGASPGLAQTAAKRLYDLVQTAAAM